MKGTLAALLVLHTLDGTDFSVTGSGPTALMFWRADCPPCLVELRNAKAYAEAANPLGRVIFVGLQEPSLLRRTAERFSAPPEMLAYTDADPKLVGGLPMTVILTPAGEVCVQHSGLLGTDNLKESMQTCRGADARH